ncbi:MAG: FlgD immunoglobulin-like domain containing protein, partial [Candidatus Cloacimonadaceae bacterium]|nr:FlgD immunoglobulin-like domain containing protein [Candidatus Cloacimonadaceae bacterium]
LPIDCVKIDISGKLPEFTDTLGCYQYPSGAGLYTVKASRWDYEDLIIPNVIVNLGEETILNIPLNRSNVSNDDDTHAPQPASFGLTSYPNPFNPSATISFIAPKAGKMKLSIYNIKGQKVRSIHDGSISSGHHSFTWNGVNESGAMAGSGVYFVRIEMDGKSQTHKMVMVK